MRAYRSLYKLIKAYEGLPQPSRFVKNHHLVKHIYNKVIGSLWINVFLWTRSSGWT